MSMPSTARRWTADEVRALPDDGNRYEVVDGELLVTPSPAFAHQRAIAVLFRALDAYLRAGGIGEVVLSPADIAFGPGTMVQPDLFVVPSIVGPVPREWSAIGPLLLAIEILSPSTARHDRFTKRRLYQRQGIPECWIVDLDARFVERWRPTDERPEMLDAHLEWHPITDAPPLTLELPALFQQILGD